MNPDEITSEVADNSVQTEPVETQQQPVETTQPTQPVQPEQSEKTSQQDTDWKKRYDDSSTEARRLKDENEKNHKTIAMLDEVFKDDKDAYEKFRSAYSKKTGQSLVEYEKAYEISQPQPIQPTNTQTPYQQPVVNSLDIETLVAKKIEETKKVDEINRKTDQAYQEYYKVYPDMNLKDMDTESIDFAKKAIVHNAINNAANLLISKENLSWDKALIEAHKLVTGQNEQEIKDAKDEAKLEGYMEAVQKNQTSSGQVTSNTKSNNNELKITDEDIKNAKLARMKPEEVARLRAKYGEF